MWAQCCELRRRAREGSSSRARYRCALRVLAVENDRPGGAISPPSRYLRPACAILVTSYTPYLEARLHLTAISVRGASMEKGDTMAISKERKAELIAQYGRDEKDSGSASVQVALLTDRIRQLTEHMKSHPKDFHTRRGLLMLVGKRRRLLSYIKGGDVEAYRTLIKSLGIRDNIQ